MLEKVTSNGIYLDVGNIDLQYEREYITVLRNIWFKRTEAAGTFAVMQLSDINQLIVTGRFFGLDSASEGSYALKVLQGMPVKIRATSNFFNGQLSLSVTEMIGWDGEIDLAKFRGEIPDYKDIWQNYLQVLGKESVISSNIAYSSIPSVCAGRVGAVALISSLVMTYLKNLLAAGIIKDDILDIADKSLGIYFRYLNFKERFESPMPAKLVEIAQTFAVGLDSRTANLVMDCGLAVMGVGNPSHLFSHLVKGQLDSVVKDLNLIYIFPLILDGTGSSVEGGVLYKY